MPATAHAESTARSRKLVAGMLPPTWSARQVLSMMGWTGR